MSPDTGFNYSVEPKQSDRVKLTEAQVDAYLDKNMGNVIWIKAGNLLAEANDACVDGRETKCIIATPGGDMALLVEAIIAMGKVFGKNLTDVEIAKGFQWRIDTLGSFYMHTDEHALENLRKSLKNDERFRRVVDKLDSVENVFKFVLNPPARYQLSLLDHLLVVDNIGCGHLKLMMSNPEAYGMSRKVIICLMRQFFNTLWNGEVKDKQKINYSYLKGEHKEGALLIAYIADETITEETLVPAIRPTDGKISMFVFHPQLTDFMHIILAEKLARSGLFPEISANTQVFLNTMRKVMGEGLRETVSRLAGDIPQIERVFHIQDY